MKTLGYVAMAALVLAPPLTLQARQAHEHQVQSDGRLAPSASAFVEGMRKLWTDHVIWTREYIVAATNDRPEASAAATRLLANQEHIGAAIVPFYGEAAGQRLTTLLKEHITVAVTVVDAARRGATAEYQKADAAWHQNGAAIAAFLSGANPHWAKATLVSMMRDHLTTTTAMVVARLKRDWDEDVRAFDEVYRHILRMSDALALGIVKQFPQRFSS